MAVVLSGGHRVQFVVPMGKRQYKKYLPGRQLSEAIHPQVVKGSRAIFKGTTQSLSGKSN